MVKTFNSSKLKTANEFLDLNKKCSGSKCDICDFYKKKLENPSANREKILPLWDHHINWSEPCDGKGCKTCHYIRKAVESGVGVPVPEEEGLRQTGFDFGDESSVDQLNKFIRHRNSEEPKTWFVPPNYAVPRVVDGSPGGSIGEDPHSHYTETVAFVTDNPLHTCERCLPVCTICGTRDTRSRIESGEHKMEYRDECRRRSEGLGLIPNYK